MGYKRIHSFQNKKSRTPQPTTQFASRPFENPVQRKTKGQMTQDELENEAFNQNKFEAFGLQLKEESGTITPVEQERLGLLQAKMDDFWTQKLEKASQFDFDLSKISVTPPGGQELITRDLTHGVQQGRGAVQLEALQKKALQPTAPREKLVAPSQALSNQPMIQRTPISEDEARERMSGAQGGWFGRNKYSIQELYDPLVESNCHGYTIHGVMGHSVQPEELYKLEESAQVAVFVKNNEIYHSGRYSNGVLTHLLIGIGVIKSLMSEDELAGHDMRLNLPKDRDALLTLIKGINDEEAIEQRESGVNSLLSRVSSYRGILEQYGEPVDKEFEPFLTYEEFDSLSDAEKDIWINANLKPIENLMNLMKKVVETESNFSIQHLRFMQPRTS